MNRKGGYVIIDLEDNILDVEDEESIATINGIYKRCEDALKLRKSILLTGVHVNYISSSMVNDCFSNLSITNQGVFMLNVGFIQDSIVVITINSDNEVKAQVI